MFFYQIIHIRNQQKQFIQKPAYQNPNNLHHGRQHQSWREYSPIPSSLLHGFYSLESWLRNLPCPSVTHGSKPSLTRQLLTVYHQQNFANRPKEEVKEIASKGGQSNHSGGFANMDPDKQVSP